MSSPNAHRFPTRMGAMWRTSIAAGFALSALTAALIGSVPAAHASANLVSNPSFETANPFGSYVSRSGTGPGPSVAAGWETFNNHEGTTTSDFIRTTLTVLGAQRTMVNVTTDDTHNGLAQQWVASGGPKTAKFSVWVFVVRGTVAAGIGNGGNTSLEVVSTTTGQWEELVGYNGSSPVNEIVVYSNEAGFTDFYVDNVHVHGS